MMSVWYDDVGTNCVKSEVTIARILFLSILLNSHCVVSEKIKSCFAPTYEVCKLAKVSKENPRYKKKVKTK